LFLQVITLFWEVLRRLSSINKKEKASLFRLKVVQCLEDFKKYGLLGIELFFGKDAKGLFF